MVQSANLITIPDVRPKVHQRGLKKRNYTPVILVLTRRTQSVLNCNCNAKFQSVIRNQLSTTNYHQSLQATTIYGKLILL